MGNWTLLKSHSRRLGLTMLACSVIPGILGCAGMGGQSGASPRGVTKEVFGKTEDGESIYLFTLVNANGVKTTITNYGGIVTSLSVPDRDGNFENIVLGFDEIAPYLTEHPYLGVTVGRYGNRIAGATFEIDGVKYALAKNDNDLNHLHGGVKHFGAVVWDAEPFTSDTGVGLRLTYLSKDGEEGYPGNLNTTVSYELTDNNALSITFKATTDKATPVNLTHHSYFNLSGLKRDILDHVVTINADRYTAADADLIPTGELADVANTPFDFREPHAVGERIGQVEGGYDLNYVLNHTTEELEKAAEAYHPETGRVIEVFTTEPGMQFYSGNFLDGTYTGWNGVVYDQHYGLCFEPQHFPDSPNQPAFPNTILRPGEEYFHHTVYKFGIRE